MSRVETVGLVIGCLGFVLAVVSLGWQVYTWRNPARFDVRVRCERDMFPEYEQLEYPMSIVVENRGGTHEAVREVSVTYDGVPTKHRDTNFYVGTDTMAFVFDEAKKDLPPRRSTRQTINIYRGERGLPKSVTVYVVLESGAIIWTDPPYFPQPA